MARECLREKTPFGVCLAEKRSRDCVAGQILRCPRASAVWPKSTNAMSIRSVCCSCRRAEPSAFGCFRIASSRAICSSAWRKPIGEDHAAEGIERSPNSAHARRCWNGSSHTISDATRRTFRLPNRFSFEDPSWVSNRLVRNLADSDARAAKADGTATTPAPASMSCITICSTINCFNGCARRQRCQISEPCKPSSSLRTGAGTPNESRSASGPTRFRRRQPANAPTPRSSSARRGSISSLKCVNTCVSGASRAVAPSPPKAARDGSASAASSAASGRLHKSAPDPCRRTFLQHHRIAVAQHQHPGAASSAPSFSDVPPAVRADVR